MAVKGTKVFIMWIFVTKSRRYDGCLDVVEILYL